MIAPRIGNEIFAKPQVLKGLQRSVFINPIAIDGQEVQVTHVDLDRIVTQDQAGEKIDIKPDETLDKYSSNL